MPNISTIESRKNMERRERTPSVTGDAKNASTITSPIERNATSATSVNKKASKCFMEILICKLHKLSWLHQCSNSFQYSCLFLKLVRRNSTTTSKCQWTHRWWTWTSNVVNRCKCLLSNQTWCSNRIYHRCSHQWTPCSAKTERIYETQKSLVCKC